MRDGTDTSFGSSCVGLGGTVFGSFVSVITDTPCPSPVGEFNIAPDFNQISITALVIVSNVHEFVSFTLTKPFNTLFDSICDFIFSTNSALLSVLCRVNVNVSPAFLSVGNHN